MRAILKYLRLSLFVGGALVGVQVPSFVDQYGQRLESHFLESKTSLANFQRDADNYFNGDLEQLIQHYRKSADPIINDGGESISKLYTRMQFLSKSWLDFNRSLYQRYKYALVSPVTPIRDATWKGYDFAVKLDINGIGWALALGLMLATLVELLLIAILSVIRHPRRRKLKNT